MVQEVGSLSDKVGVGGY